MKSSSSSSYFPALPGMKKDYSVTPEQRPVSTPRHVQYVPNTQHDPYFLPPLTQMAKAAAVANAVMVQDVLRHLATSGLFSHCPHAVTASDSDIQLYISLSTNLPPHNTILAMLHNSIDLSVGNIDVTSTTTLPPHILTPLPCPSPSPLCLLHCLSTLGLRMDSVSHLHRIAHALTTADPSSLRMALGPQQHYAHKRAQALPPPLPEPPRPSVVTATVAGVCMWCRYWRLAGITAARAPVPDGRVDGCSECMAEGEVRRMYLQYPLWHASLPLSSTDARALTSTGTSLGASPALLARTALSLPADPANPTASGPGAWREVGVRAVRLGVLGARGRHLMALVWGRRARGEYALCGQTEVVAKPIPRPLLRSNPDAAESGAAGSTVSSGSPADVAESLSGIQYEGGGVCTWRTRVTLAWGVTRRSETSLSAIEPLPATPLRTNNADVDDINFDEDEEDDEDVVEEAVAEDLPYEYRVCVYALRDPSTVADSDLLGSVRVRSEELLYTAARARDDACRHHHGWGCGQNWGGYTVQSAVHSDQHARMPDAVERGPASGLAASYGTGVARAVPEISMEEHSELLSRGGVCGEPACVRSRIERRTAMRAHVLCALGDRGGDTDTESEEEEESVQSHVAEVGAQLLAWRGGKERGKRKKERGEGRAHRRGVRSSTEDDSDGAGDEDRWEKVDGVWVARGGNRSPCRDRKGVDGCGGNRERRMVSVDDQCAGTRAVVAVATDDDGDVAPVLKRRAAARVGALVSYVAAVDDARRDARTERKRASAAARAEYWRDFTARAARQRERRAQRQVVRVAVPFEVAEVFPGDGSDDGEIARVKEQQLCLTRTAERLRAAAERAQEHVAQARDTLVPVPPAEAAQTRAVSLVAVGDVPAVVFEWEEPLLAAVHEHGDADESAAEEEERAWAERVQRERECAKLERQRVRREKRAREKREREEREAREREAARMLREERRRREEEAERRRVAFLAEVRAVKAAMEAVEQRLEAEREAREQAAKLAEERRRKDKEEREERERKVKEEAERERALRLLVLDEDAARRREEREAAVVRSLAALAADSEEEVDAELDTALAPRTASAEVAVAGMDAGGLASAIAAKRLRRRRAKQAAEAAAREEAREREATAWAREREERESARAAEREDRGREREQMLMLMELRRGEERAERAIRADEARERQREREEREAARERREEQRLAAAATREDARAAAAEARAREDREGDAARARMDALLRAAQVEMAAQPAAPAPVVAPVAMPLQHPLTAIAVGTGTSTGMGMYPAVSYAPTSSSALASIPPVGPAAGALVPYAAVPTDAQARTPGYAHTHAPALPAPYAADTGASLLALPSTTTMPAFSAPVFTARVTGVAHVLALHIHAGLTARLARAATATTKAAATAVPSSSSSTYSNGAVPAALVPPESDAVLSSLLAAGVTAASLSRVWRWLQRECVLSLSLASACACVSAPFHRSTTTAATAAPVKGAMPLAGRVAALPPRSAVSRSVFLSLLMGELADEEAQRQLQRLVRGEEDEADEDAEEEGAGGVHGDNTVDGEEDAVGTVRNNTHDSVVVVRPRSRRKRATSSTLPLSTPSPAAAAPQPAPRLSPQRLLAAAALLSTHPRTQAPPSTASSLALEHTLAVPLAAPPACPRCGPAHHATAEGVAVTAQPVALVSLRMHRRLTTEGLCAPIATAVSPFDFLADDDTTATSALTSASASVLSACASVRGGAVTAWWSFEGHDMSPWAFLLPPAEAEAEVEVKADAEGTGSVPAAGNTITTPADAAQPSMVCAGVGRLLAVGAVRVPACGEGAEAGSVWVNMYGVSEDEAAETESQTGMEPKMETDVESNADVSADADAASRGAVPPEEIAIEDGAGGQDGHANATTTATPTAPFSPKATPTRSPTRGSLRLRPLPLAFTLEPRLHSHPLAPSLALPAASALPGRVPRWLLGEEALLRACAWSINQRVRALQQTVVRTQTHSDTVVVALGHAADEHASQRDTVARLDAVPLCVQWEAHHGNSATAAVPDSAARNVTGDGAEVVPTPAADLALAGPYAWALVRSAVDTSTASTASELHAPLRGMWRLPLPLQSDVTAADVGHDSTLTVPVDAATRALETLCRDICAALEAGASEMEDIPLLPVADSTSKLEDAANAEAEAVTALAPRSASPPTALPRTASHLATPLSPENVCLVTVAWAPCLPPTAPAHPTHAAVQEPFAAPSVQVQGVGAPRQVTDTQAADEEEADVNAVDVVPDGTPGTESPSMASLLADTPSPLPLSTPCARGDSLLLRPVAVSTPVALSALSLRTAHAHRTRKGRHTTSLAPASAQRQAQGGAESSFSAASGAIAAPAVAVSWALQLPPDAAPHPAVPVLLQLVALPRHALIATSSSASTSATSTSTTSSTFSGSLLDGSLPARTAALITQRAHADVAHAATVSAQLPLWTQYLPLTCATCVHAHSDASANALVDTSASPSTSTSAPTASAGAVHLTGPSPALSLVPASHTRCQRAHAHLLGVPPPRPSLAPLELAHTSLLPAAARSHHQRLLDAARRTPTPAPAQTDTEIAAHSSPPAEAPDAVLLSLLLRDSSLPSPLAAPLTRSARMLAWWLALPRAHTQHHKIHRSGAAATDAATDMSPAATSGTAVHSFGSLAAALLPSVLLPAHPHALLGTHSTCPLPPLPCSFLAPPRLSPALCCLQHPPLAHLATAMAALQARLRGRRCRMQLLREADEAAPAVLLAVTACAVVSTDTLAAANTVSAAEAEANADAEALTEVVHTGSARRSATASTTASVTASPTSVLCVLVLLQRDTGLGQWRVAAHSRPMPLPSPASAEARAPSRLRPHAHVAAAGAPAGALPPFSFQLTHTAGGTTCLLVALLLRSHTNTNTSSTTLPSPALSFSLTDPPSPAPLPSLASLPRFPSLPPDALLTALAHLTEANIISPLAPVHAHACDASAAALPLLAVSAASFSSLGLISAHLLPLRLTTHPYRHNTAFSTVVASAASAPLPSFLSISLTVTASSPLTPQAPPPPPRALPPPPFSFLFPSHAAAHAAAPVLARAPSLAALPLPSLPTFSLTLAPADSIRSLLQRLLADADVGVAAKTELTQTRVSARGAYVLSAIARPLARSPTLTAATDTTTIYVHGAPAAASATVILVAVLWARLQDRWLLASSSPVASLPEPPFLAPPAAHSSPLPLSPAARLLHSLTADARTPSPASDPADAARADASPARRARFTVQARLPHRASSASDDSQDVLMPRLSSASSISASSSAPRGSLRMITPIPLPNLPPTPAMSPQTRPLAPAASFGGPTLDAAPALDTDIPAHAPPPGVPPLSLSTLLPPHIAAQRPVLFASQLYAVALDAASPSSLLSAATASRGRSVLVAEGHWALDTLLRARRVALPLHLRTTPVVEVPSTTATAAATADTSASSVQPDAPAEEPLGLTVYLPSSPSSPSPSPSILTATLALGPPAPAHLLDHARTLALTLARPALGLRPQLLAALHAALDPARLRRLAARTLAVRVSLEGAGWLWARAALAHPLLSERVDAVLTADTAEEDAAALAVEGAPHGDRYIALPVPRPVQPLVALYLRPGAVDAHPVYGAPALGSGLTSSASNPWRLAAWTEPHAPAKPYTLLESGADADGDYGSGDVLPTPAFAAAHTPALAAAAAPTAALQRRLSRSPSLPTRTSSVSSASALATRPSAAAFPAQPLRYRVWARECVWERPLLLSLSSDEDTRTVAVASGSDDAEDCDVQVLRNGALQALDTTLQLQVSVLDATLVARASNASAGTSTGATPTTLSRRSSSSEELLQLAPITLRGAGAVDTSAWLHALAASRRNGTAAPPLVVPLAPVSARVLGADADTEVGARPGDMANSIATAGADAQADAPVDSVHSACMQFWASSQLVVPPAAPPSHTHALDLAAAHVHASDSGLYSQARLHAPATVLASIGAASTAALSDAKFMLSPHWRLACCASLWLTALPWAEVLAAVAAREAVAVLQRHGVRAGASVREVALLADRLEEEERRREEEAARQRDEAERVRAAEEAREREAAEAVLAAQAEAERRALEEHAAALQREQERAAREAAAAAEAVERHALALHVASEAARAPADAAMGDGRNTILDDAATAVHADSLTDAREVADSFYLAAGVVPTDVEPEAATTLVLPPLPPATTSTDTAVSVSVPAFTDTESATAESTIIAESTTSLRLLVASVPARESEAENVPAPVAVRANDATAADAPPLAREATRVDEIPTAKANKTTGATAEVEVRAIVVEAAVEASVDVETEAAVTADLAAPQLDWTGAQSPLADTVSMAFYAQMQPPAPHPPTFHVAPQISDQDSLAASQSSPERAKTVPAASAEDTTLPTNADASVFLAEVNMPPVHALNASSVDALETGAGSAAAAADTNVGTEASGTAVAVDSDTFDATDGYMSAHASSPVAAESLRGSPHNPQAGDDPEDEVPGLPTPAVNTNDMGDTSDPSELPLQASFPAHAVEAALSRSSLISLSHPGHGGYFDPYTRPAHMTAAGEPVLTPWGQMTDMGDEDEYSPSADAAVSANAYTSPAQAAGAVSPIFTDVSAGEDEFSVQQALPSRTMLTDPFAVSAASSSSSALPTMGKARWDDNGGAVARLSGASASIFYVDDDF